LQERCAEEASTSGADRSGSDIEPLITNEQLAMERRNLQDVERLLKSVDKVLKCFLLTGFIAWIYSYRDGITSHLLIYSGLSDTVFA